MSAPPEARFRERHPLFFWGTVAIIALLVTGSAVLAVRVVRYNRETAQISRQMTSSQRETRDELLANKARRTRLALAVLQRDLRVRSLENAKRHLAVVLEDSVLELRHGAATLRRARIAIGPDSVVRAPDGRSWRFVRGIGERRIAELRRAPVYTVPDWVYVSRGQPIPAAGERRVPGGLGEYVIRLDDGTEIYSQPQAGPLRDAVKPAGFMAQANDLAAIFDAVGEDTPVYIY